MGWIYTLKLAVVAEYERCLNEDHGSGLMLAIILPYM